MPLLKASETSANLNLLLVDDDSELCNMMVQFFSQAGHQLDCAYDGPSGLQKACESMYDVVLLDVMLPFINGFSVLQQLRRRRNVPTILLTARVDREDRIQGLNKGADDYVLKPFDADELLARIHAVLRRSGGQCGSHRVELRLPRIHFDALTRKVTVNGEQVELTALEFDILEMLVRSAGHIVSREEISEALLERSTSPYDRALDVHVSRLRSKLGIGHDLIRTVRGIGYLFTSTLEKR